MIESIEFTNFKALRKTTLPLAPFTLLLGPNGAGKTSVLQALQCVLFVAAQEAGIQPPYGPKMEMVFSSLRSVTTEERYSAVEIKLRLRLEKQIYFANIFCSPTANAGVRFLAENGAVLRGQEPALPRDWLLRKATYAFDSSAIAQPFPVNSGPMQFNGSGLVAVLDDLKDNHPKRWSQLLDELCRWLPEYDQIQFDKPQNGQKAIVLRTKKGGYRIPATDLSQGTLIALALLTLAYLPNPPSLIGLEEIDRGLHPRLLRHLQDAIYRLTYPESCGEKRQPIQVIATTHSPYLLDLYRDHPEEVIIAQKEGLEVNMKQLREVDHYEEIVANTPLSEVWYSGVLGGVAVKP